MRKIIFGKGFARLSQADQVAVVESRLTEIYNDGHGNVTDRQSESFRRNGLRIIDKANALGLPVDADGEWSKVFRVSKW